MPKVRNWKPDQLPDLTGKTYLITGGNSGIGLEAAKILGASGGKVIIACRNPDKAKTAAAEINTVSSVKTGIVQLDLANLSSVRKAATSVKRKYKKIDALINNAGIMQTPKLETADGFEMQLGTNHLGHFLWTGLLFDRVERAQGRVVTLSSIAHKYGKIHFNNLMLDRGYMPMKAYTQSKHANMLFGLELARRLDAAGSAVKSIICHPGYANTNLQSSGPKGIWNTLYKPMNSLIAQSAYRGAIPTVLAAAGLEAEHGQYYGPTGMGDTRGPVGTARIIPHAKREKPAKKLWEISEDLTGFKWSFG